MPTPRDLGRKLKEKGARAPRTGRRDPLWRGPEKDGVTFSLLSRYLVCKERFRLLVMEGLRPEDGFNHRLGYGSMWHVCQQSWSEATNHTFDEGADAYDRETYRNARWQTELLDFCRSLCRQYPTQQEQIKHWWEVCKIQYPLYHDWWEKHDDLRKAEGLLPEAVFSVPYLLSSGRTVRLRGKWDNVLKLQEGKQTSLYVLDHKTKGDIWEEGIRKQLYFDLQTMLYVVAFEAWQGLDDYGDPIRTPELTETPVAGVYYDVVRRPLSGGRGSIKQNKGETPHEFYARLGEIIRGAHGPEWNLAPGHHNYFKRWQVTLLPQDIARFKRQCLDPILDNLCDDWEWFDVCASKGHDLYDHDRRSRLFSFHQQRHFRYPFGVYNVLAEGGSSELDEYLATGSEVGLRRVNSLYEELA